MAYAYYQTAQGERWGTPEVRRSLRLDRWIPQAHRRLLLQYRFGEPPTPGWEPQGHWGGQDYFAAHAFAGDECVLYTLQPHPPYLTVFFLCAIERSTKQSCHACPQRQA